jgi:hypothetical protein
MSSRKSLLLLAGLFALSACNHPTTSVNGSASASVSASASPSVSEASTSTSVPASESASQSVSVAPADVYVVTITDKTVTALLYGRTLTLAATVTHNGEANEDGVEWSSSDATIAVVDSETGVVTGKKKGTATITATSKADSKAIDTIDITVSYPAFDQAKVGVTTNYTAFIIDNADANNKTYNIISIGTNWFEWYATAASATKYLGITHGAGFDYYLGDGGVYATTDIAQDSTTKAYSATYYYEDYLTKSDKSKLTTDEFKAAYDVSAMIGGSTWGYAGYNANKGFDYYLSGAKGEGTAAADGFTQFILSAVDPIKDTVNTTYPKAFTEFLINADGTLEQFAIFNPGVDGAKDTLLFWGYFDSVGTSLSFTTATKLFFRPAGSGDEDGGDGEDFDPAAGDGQ